MHEPLLDGLRVLVKSALGDKKRLLDLALYKLKTLLLSDMFSNPNLIIKRWLKQFLRESISLKPFVSFARATAAAIG